MSATEIIAMASLAFIILGSNLIIFKIGKNTGKREMMTEILHDMKKEIDKHAKVIASELTDKHD